jgi:hypothetical protein
MFRLLFGSPRVTVDLVTADSQEGSPPNVLGNIGSNDLNPRTSYGDVSDPRILRR